MSKHNHTKKQIVKPEKAQGELISTSDLNVETIRKREMKVDEKITCSRWEPNPYNPDYVCGALQISYRSAILPSTFLSIRVYVQA